MIDQISLSPSGLASTLDPDALRELVDELSARPHLWESRVRHEPSERVIELLTRDERVEVWLICWGGREHDTGFHDHDLSNGALAVVRGELIEERLGLYGPIERRLRPGRSVAFPPSHVHRVRGVGASPAVSLHAYSPPLARMGVYAVAPDGALRRDSVSATHELRHGDQPAAA
jgi:mannose-6-phosphate isomerase-like protein (cupin superfamily)